MPHLFPLAVELNGWRYEAAHQSVTDTWTFAKNRIAGHYPTHNYHGYEHLQEQKGLLPEEALTIIHDWAKVECTLY